MGGPFWGKKDEGTWSIPKGEFDDDENPLEAAKREFEEETNIKPEGEFIELNPTKQPSGKQVFAWAFEGNCDPSKIISNTFKMEWPPKSGKMVEFPEIDKAGWFPTEIAQLKILKGQRGFINELVSILNYDSGNEKRGMRK
jgi:predicted NUDIX family NTP pyrophosphohydrolase